jgi:hypothetical protein
MRNVVKLLVAFVASATVHLLAGSGSALAVTEVRSPFGSSPVQAFIGSSPSLPFQIGGPFQIILWRRLSDSACLGTVIGNESGLFDDYEVLASSGNDRIRILPTGDSNTPFCGVSMNGLIYGGHYLDLFGLGGNDQLSTGNGDTWMWGQDGDDSLISNGFGVMYGGAGNDVLVAISAIFNNEALFGENGNDCLEDRNAAALSFDCGAGTDRYVTFFGTPISTNCETPISTGCH